MLMVLPAPGLLLTSIVPPWARTMLMASASQRLGCSPAAIRLEQLDAPLVLAFLEHLQARRSNSPSTRDACLAAIKSFMRFLILAPRHSAARSLPARCPRRLISTPPAFRVLSTPPRIRPVKVRFTDSLRVFSTAME